jgi:hypothetical protein
MADNIESTRKALDFKGILSKKQSPESILQRVPKYPSFGKHKAAGGLEEEVKKIRRLPPHEFKHRGQGLRHSEHLMREQNSKEAESSQKQSHEPSHHARSVLSEMTPYSLQTDKPFKSRKQRTNQEQFGLKQSSSLKQTQSEHAVMFIGITNNSDIEYVLQLCTEHGRVLKHQYLPSTNYIIVFFQRKEEVHTILKIQIIQIENNYITIQNYPPQILSSTKTAEQNKLRGNENVQKFENRFDFLEYASTKNTAKAPRKKFNFISKFLEYFLNW